MTVIVTEGKIMAHLYALGNGDALPIHIGEGICNEINDVFDVTINEIIFTYWPDFSGDIYYPVPDAWDICTARDAYECSSNLWDEDLYGNSRRELCVWLANNIKNGNIVLSTEVLMPNFK